MSQNNVQLQSGNGQLAGFRNILMNGGNAVSRRYAQPASNAAETRVAIYPFDRWFVGNVTSPINYAWSSDVTYRDSRPAMSISVNQPNWYIGQNIEFKDARKLAGLVCTMSFWAKSSSPQNCDFGWAWVDHVTGSGVPIPGTTNYSEAISLQSTWTFHTITFVMPDLNSINPANFVDTWAGQAALINLDANTIVELQDLQLEAGPVATPFEVVPQFIEKPLLERFLTVWSPSIGLPIYWANNNVFIQIPETNRRPGTVVSKGATQNTSFYYYLENQAPPTRVTVQSSTWNFVLAGGIGLSSDFMSTPWSTGAEGLLGWCAVNDEDMWIDGEWA